MIQSSTQPLALARQRASAMNTKVYAEKKEFAAPPRPAPAPEKINDLLTPRALAYWFMDDGFQFNMTKNRRRYRYYALSTNSFPLEDQKRLVQALKDNFSIHTTIQKERFYPTLRWIYIRSESTNRFVDLIRSYIHRCFDYKIQ